MGKGRGDQMQLQTQALVIVGVYLVVMLSIGFIVGKLNIKNSEDYMVAGRRMGLFFVAFSLSANNIGGGSTTGLAQRAYGEWGLSAVWYVLAASIAMIPLAYFAPKIRKTMAVTIPEVVGRRFGNASSSITAVLSVLSLFCLTSSQIAAAGSVVSTLLGIPTNVALVAAGFVVIFYTTFGGMVADQVADLIQFCVILVGLGIATPFVIDGCGGWEAVSAALPPAQLDFTTIGVVTIIGYIFNYFCTFLAGPEMVSRFESAKDEKTATRAAWLSAVLMAAMAFFPTLLGLCAAATMPDLPNAGANAMLEVTTAHAPGFVAGIVCAAIICATMSSADSNLLCMSTMLMNDLYLKYGGKKLTDKVYVDVRRAHRHDEHVRLRHPLRRPVRGLRPWPRGQERHQELRHHLARGRHHRLHLLAGSVGRRLPVRHPARRVRLLHLGRGVLHRQRHRVEPRRRARSVRLSGRVSARTWRICDALSAT